MRSANTGSRRSANPTPSLACGHRTRPGYLVHSASRASGDTGWDHERLLAAVTEMRACANSCCPRQRWPSQVGAAPVGKIRHQACWSRWRAMVAPTRSSTPTPPTPWVVYQRLPVRLGWGRAVDVEQAEREPGASRDWSSRWSAISVRSRMTVWTTACSVMSTASPSCRALRTQIQFSYLGRLDLGGVTINRGPYSRPYIDALPDDPEPDLPLRFALNISAFVATMPEGTQLITNWRWSDALFAPPISTH